MFNFRAEKISVYYMGMFSDVHRKTWVSIQVKSSIPVADRSVLKFNRSVKSDNEMVLFENMKYAEEHDTYY